MCKGIRKRYAGICLVLNTLFKLVMYFPKHEDYGSVAFGDSLDGIRAEIVMDNV